MAAAEARGADFPVGLKVLVVDDDPTCLVVLKRMLLECRDNMSAGYKSTNYVARK